jgi:hypothetical protein
VKVTVIVLFLFLGLKSTDDSDKYRNVSVPLNRLHNPESFNLLIKAVEKNDANAVDYFLNTDIDVNYIPEMHSGLKEAPLDAKQQCKFEMCSAANVAYRNKFYDILLKLLSNNSRYPDDFQFGSASIEIQNFVEEMQNFHELIRNSNAVRCTDLIKKYPNLKYFFNTSNKSACMVALESRKLAMYELLVQNSIHIAPHEDLNRHLRDASVKGQIVKIHNMYAVETDELTKLLSKTFFNFDNTNIADCSKHVKSAYKYLWNIPEMKVILQLFVAFGKYTIHCDFNRDTLQYLVLSDASQSIGACTYSNQLCFSARGLLNSETKHSVYGTIAHEFCHVAMQIVFRNESRPYSYGDIESAEKFNQIVEIYKILMVKEPVVAAVYEAYNRDLWSAELIVRVVQMIACYSNDPDKLKTLRQSFAQLFKFYKSHVHPNMVRALPFIRKFSNGNYFIKWDDLPKSLKVTCMNKKLINFQGAEVSLYEMVGYDEGTVLDCLSAEHIWRLLDGKIIEIGCKLDKIPDYVERKFARKTAAEDPLALSQNLIILSDEAGAGKTTTFKHLAWFLKEKYPAKWILYIDLKKYLNVYEKFKHEAVRARDILVEIQELKDWNLIVFKEMYECGNVIIFWDGLDEISPLYKDFMAKVIESFGESRNHQWISSRPEHIARFEQMSYGSVYKLAEYSFNDRMELIKSYLKEEGNLNESKIDETIGKIEEFFKSIESKSNNNFNNPLMIWMLVNILSESEFDLDLLSNAYQFYERFINDKIIISNQKGKIVTNSTSNIFQRDNFVRLHQIFALKLIFGDYFDKPNEAFPISTPSLVHEKSKKSCFEEISRFGILQIIDDENYSFCHRSFAEFFVAQYLIENVYKLNDYNLPRDDDEIDKRLQLLIHVIFKIEHRRICKLVEDYINLNMDDDKAEFSILYESVIQRSFATPLFSALQNLNRSAVYALAFASKFFRKCGKILRSIWSFDENETVYVKFAKDPNSVQHLSELRALCDACFRDEEELQHVLYGTHQRGNVLYNIWLRKEDQSKLDQSCLYSDKLVPEILKLDGSFRDFFKFVEDHLTIEELQELYLRNSCSIFFEENIDAGWLVEKWVWAEHILSDIDLKKLLLNVFFEYDDNDCLVSFSILTKSIQMLNEDYTTYILDKYKRHFGIQEIKNFIFKHQMYSEKGFLDFVIKGQNGKVCRILWKFIIESEFTEVERRLLFDEKAFASLTFIRNEEIFEIMEVQMHSLYTDDEIREIFWAQRDNLLSNLISYSSTEVCERFCKLMENQFSGKLGLKEFVAALYENLKNINFSDLPERLKLLSVAKYFKANSGSFFAALNERLAKLDDALDKCQLQEKIEDFIHENYGNWIDCTKDYIKNAEIFAAIFLQSNMETSCSNFYSLFDSYLAALQVNFESKERFEKALKYQQNEAAKLLINDEFSLNFENLEVSQEDISKFEHFSLKSADESDSDNDNEIFAHFFIAKYIIEHIYDADGEISENNVKLLAEVEQNVNLTATHGLILNYVEAVERSFSNSIKLSKFKQLFSANYENCFERF